MTPPGKPGNVGEFMNNSIDTDESALIATVKNKNDDST